MQRLEDDESGFVASRISNKFSAAEVFGQSPGMRSFGGPAAAKTKLWLWFKGLIMLDFRRISVFINDCISIVFSLVYQ